MLAAAADRERTMDVLKAAFMEGRLTKSEFDERSARVLTARTYGDLTAMVADLPAGPGAPAAQMMPYQQAYYSPIMIQRTNGFAIGALVCGIVPFFGGIPAIILGHVARGQIRRSGDRGDGMAISGLVLGYLWVSLWVLILLIGLAQR
jgi:tetrahydromethanopterin S-methyltransferase subunit F